MVLHGIAWYCMDIAVLAQKVKVIADWCDLKKCGGSVVGWYG